jgi:hypothetical protein
VPVEVQIDFMEYVAGHTLTPKSRGGNDIVFKLGWNANQEAG